jgi:1,4-dihydroxy-2-naphthoate octaprenyltransferase
VNVWVEAARPRTLVAAVTPVVVGTAAAERVIAWRAACALGVAVAIQVGVNYANDYYDGVRGVDTETRVGPRRAVAAGLVAPAAMKAAMLAALALACALGAALALAVEPWLLAVGAACVLAAVGYSGGPRPYASLGLGEPFVFLFFGVVATAGSAYVQDEALRAVPLVASIPIGLLATAILMVNNLRDLATDAVAGKRTLAVRLGPERARAAYRAAVVTAYAAAPVVALTAGSPWPLLAWLSAPLARRALAATRAGEPRRLLPALVLSARLELVYGILLALGLVAA